MQPIDAAQSDRARTLCFTEEGFFSVWRCFCESVVFGHAFFVSVSFACGTLGSDTHSGKCQFVLGLCTYTAVRKKSCHLALKIQRLVLTSVHKNVSLFLAAYCFTHASQLAFVTPEESLRRLRNCDISAVYEDKNGRAYPTRVFTCPHNAFPGTVKATSRLWDYCAAPSRSYTEPHYDFPLGGRCQNVTS